MTEPKEVDGSRRVFYTNEKGQLHRYAHVIKDPLTKYYELSKKYFFSSYENLKILSTDTFKITTKLDFDRYLPIDKFKIYDFYHKKYYIIYFTKHPLLYDTGLVYDASSKDESPIALYKKNVLIKISPHYSDEKIEKLELEFNSYIPWDDYDEDDGRNYDGRDYGGRNGGKRRNTKKDKSPPKTTDLDLYKKDLAKLRNDIKNTRGEYTKELEMEAARLYAINPKELGRVINEYNIKGYMNYILPKCKNLTYKGDKDIVVYQDPDTNVYWCYDQETWSKKRKEFNPYNLKNVKREFNSEIVKNKSIKLSREAYDNLKFWTEYTFTLGKVFYNVPENIAQEFAKTIQEGETYHLFRGMTFETEADYAKFLSKYKCGDHGKRECEINFDTFSSWTYNIDVAKNFAGKFFHGIIIEAYFDSNELLIDITKVNDGIFKDRLRYSEDEVIAIPFKGNVTVYDFDPNLKHKFGYTQKKKYNSGAKLGEHVWHDDSSEDSFSFYISDDSFGGKIADTNVELV